MSTEITKTLDAGYQTRIFKQATKSLRDGRNVLLAAPTGSGKSGVLSSIALAYVKNPRNRGRKVLILEDARPMVTQMAGNPSSRDEQKRKSEVMDWVGFRPGRIADVTEGGDDQEPLIVVGIVDSVVKRIVNAGNLLPPDYLADYGLIIIDEAHHAPESDKLAYGMVLDYFEKRFGNISVLGASATPYRASGITELDRRLTGDKVDRFDVMYQEAIDANRIMAPKTFLGDARNEKGQTLSDILMQAIERDGFEIAMERAGDIYRELNDKTFRQRSVARWWKLAADKRSIWYTSSQDQANEIADAMLVNGLVEGRDFVRVFEGSKVGPETVRERFAKGTLAAAISVAMLTEGFDAPRTDVVVTAFAGTTLARQLQIGGRSMRRPVGVEKDQPLFMDLGLTTYMHGSIEQRIDRENKMATAKGRAEFIKSWTKLENNWCGWSDGRRDFYLRKETAGWHLMVFTPVDGIKKGISHRPLTDRDLVPHIEDIAISSDQIHGMSLLPPTSRGRESGVDNLAQEYMRRRLMREPFFEHTAGSAKQERHRPDVDIDKSELEMWIKDLNKKAFKLKKALNAGQNAHDEAIEFRATGMRFLAIFNEEAVSDTKKHTDQIVAAIHGGQKVNEIALAELMGKALQKRSVVNALRGPSAAKALPDVEFEKFKQLRSIIATMPWAGKPPAKAATQPAVQAPPSAAAPVKASSADEGMAVGF